MARFWSYQALCDSYCVRGHIEDLVSAHHYNQYKRRCLAQTSGTLVKSRAMNQRVHGRTGLQVSELALGGLFVSSYGSQYEEASAAIARALQLGVNYIDTAPGYGNSEEVLGKAFAELRDQVETPIILSSKLGGRPTPFEP